MKIKDNMLLYNRERNYVISASLATGSLLSTSCSWKVSVKVKGKVIPLQAWTGPEGSRRLRSPDFKTIGT